MTTVLQKLLIMSVFAGRFLGYRQDHREPADSSDSSTHQFHCYDKEYEVAVVKSWSEKASKVTFQPEQLVEGVLLAQVWPRNGVQYCQKDYLLICALPDKGEPTAWTFVGNMVTGLAHKVFGHRDDDEEEARAAIEIRSGCVRANGEKEPKVRQVFKVVKRNGMGRLELPLEDGAAYLGVKPEAAMFHTKGSKILLTAKPWKAHDIRALQAELEEHRAQTANEGSGAGKSMDELEFAHFMAQKEKLEDKERELLNSGYDALKESVTDLRRKLGQAEDRLQDFRRQQDAGALSKLQEDAAALDNFVRTFEPGSEAPDVSDQEIRPSAAAADDLPENAQWPPTISEVSEDVSGLGAVAQLKQETAQLRQRTDAMQMILFELREAEKDLRDKLQAAQTLEVQLQPQADAVTSKAKVDQLGNRVKGLRLAVQHDFPRQLFRIRKLSLLAERGGQVTTLLEQIRATLKDKSQQKRFENFAKLGLVDKDRLDRHLSLEEQVMEKLNANSMAAIWSELRASCHEAVSAWEVAFDSCQAGESCSLPDLSPGFVAKEQALSMLVDTWLQHADGGGPLCFDEELLETYLNWVEDLNGAVRVYVKVTNREDKTAGSGISNSILACASKSSSYVPDRKVRLLACDQEPPASSNLCEQLTGPDGDASVPAATAYGPYYGIFSSPDDPQHIDVTDNPRNEQLYDSDLIWAPGLKSVLQQVKSGYTVVLFGYGYSGTGKTFTLLGNRDTRGVVTIGLDSLGSELELVSVRIKELYGKMRLEDGRPISGESGIYSYTLKLRDDGQLETVPCGDGKQCLQTSFWGRHPAVRKGEDEEYPPEFGLDVSPQDFKGFMERDSIKIPGNNISSFLDSAFSLVGNTRVHASCRTNKDQGCPRIRSTPNNPESSRGHLFTILDVQMKGSSKKGTIVVVDMAGAENPLAIAKDHVDYSVTGMSENEVDAYLGKNLKFFDKAWGPRRLKLWQTTAGGVTKSINLENARRFVGKAFISQLGKDPQAEDKILKAWTDDKIKKELMPMVQEGVFVNEGLNHLRQFLLWRGNKLEKLTQGVDGRTFAWENDDKDDATYRPEVFIQPAKIVRVANLHYVGDKRRLTAVGTYSTYPSSGSFDKPRVPLVKSGACAVEWDEKECGTYPVDGFAKDAAFADKFVDDGGALSRKYLQDGELAKVDPMLMLSMLHYFDHPEAFGPSGKLDEMKRPTKFIMLAAVRREHPKQRSQADEALKLNICRGTEATLKFTDSLNPLSN